MSTERDTWMALIQWANHAGRRGYWVRNAQVIPPATAAQNYSLVLEEYRPRDAGEMEP